MFRKVLIADDYDSNNQPVAQLLLKKLNVSNVSDALYCDDALLKFKKALQDDSPFELLITDLSFLEDYRERKLTTGLELIDAVRKLQPKVKVIVFAGEKRPSKIKQIIASHSIDAYVPKGRSALKDLEKAIISINKEGTYFPHELEHNLKNEQLLILENYDKDILKHIACGGTKEEVSAIFKTKKISPCSVSSIEKRLQKLYLSFNAKNTTHLIFIAQKEGLI